MKLYKEALRSFFSGYVSALRRRRGLTQEEMAERLRITGRAYSDLERGIYCLLRGLGLRADSSWFFHVSYAVYLTVRRPDQTVLAERWLYPAVAQHYHTGSLDIKRSICFAVDLIWKTDRRTLRVITRCPLERKPHPSEFVALLAACLAGGNAA